jgi:hypothetical protein
MNNPQTLSSYNLSPEAPDDDDHYSDQDYKIAEFKDLNDNDVIYVRWSVLHSRAYMYSDLDAATQWVLPHWKIRKTIEVGMGMGHRVGEYEFEFEGVFIIEHRERLAADGLSELETLYHDNDVDYHKIERILDEKWDGYAANKIWFDFSVR